MDNEKTQEILAQLDRLREMIAQDKGELASPAAESPATTGGPSKDVAQLLDAIRRTVATPDALQSGYTMVLALLESREGKERSSMVGAASETDLGKMLVSDEEMVAFASAFTNSGRLKIMRAVSRSGRTSAELSEETGLVGGQLYHHLKELVRGGFVLQQDRNSYVLSPQIGKSAYLGMHLLARTVARAAEKWGRRKE